jgi:hypothetical protein
MRRNKKKKKKKPVHKILEQSRPHWFLEFLDRWAVALTEERADDECNMFDEAWRELVELTATDAPAQKYNMPTVYELTKAWGKISVEYLNKSEHLQSIQLGHDMYDNLRNKIIGLK